MKIEKTYNDVNFVNFLLAYKSLKKNMENNFVPLVAYPGALCVFPRGKDYYLDQVITPAITFQNTNSWLAFFIYSETDDTISTAGRVQFHSKLNIKFVMYVQAHMPAGRLIHISLLGIYGKALTDWK